MNKNRDLQRTVNLEYAIIQGIYWAGYCALVSYAAVYLQARGYSNAGLGGILAVGYILGFLLPQVLASWVDRSERLTVYHCQWGLLIVQTVLVFLLQMMPGKSPAVSILTSLLIGAEITLNPMNTEISADLELGVCHVNYGAARGTGSIAFAPVSMLLGKLLEARGIGPLPWINYGFILLQALALLSLQITVRGRVRKESVAGKSTHASSSREFFLENMGFFGLLLGVGLLFFGHNLTTNYLINIVRNVGGDTSDMGLLSGYTAIMEIPMMFLYDRLLKRVRCEDTVRFSAAMFAMKAFSVAMARSMGGLFAANIFQMLSFAMMTPALVQYVNLHIPHKDSAKGQAAAFGTITLGNVTSSWFGGGLYDAMGVRSTLMIGVAATLCGALICQVFTKSIAGSRRTICEGLSNTSDEPRV